MKKVPLTRGYWALVDDEDYDRVMQYSWHVAIDDHTRYASTDVSGKDIKMHRFILEVEEKSVFVDHRDGDGLDNRKENIRVCTHKQNSYNQKPRSRVANARKSSKYKGVARYKGRTWKAAIYKDGKTYHLGYYHDEQQAAKVYDQKAKELFGDFAYLNFPDTERATVCQ